MTSTSQFSTPSSAMKRASLLIAALSVALNLGASAATQISYSASSDPNNNPDANANTVDVWTVTRTSGNSSENGSFLGDSSFNGNPGGAGSSGAGAGTSAWGLYANSGQTTR